MKNILVFLVQLEQKYLQENDIILKIFEYQKGLNAMHSVLFSLKVSHKT